ncbi:hypothetical protein F3S47_18460 [Histidinibacterium aquaticum]|uniref:Uncharacterized protein n=1 Tax=Histidinibacterium aquaticum TaxID=2613962 RepID=A0A5J5GBC1_9RHOB|nr:hypothetical protein F3S47_18460 [Histidinibacterium aquaticum]
MAAASRPGGVGLTGTEIVAAGLSAIWVLAVGAFFLMQPPAVAQQSGGLRLVVAPMAVFLPVAMIWVAASAARSARLVREESARLQAAIDAMRKGYVEDRQGRGADVTMERRLAEIASSVKRTEALLSERAAPQSAPAPAPEPAAQERVEEQPTLAFAPAPEDTAPPLDRIDLIRALNFPDTDQDHEGFAALKRALKDRQARQLIQASQDVLTLLSQDGIYMDDLRPDLARPEVWRRFAQGERGRAIGDLGGVHDRTSLALSAARMREDTIFRDAVHHFLRRFDQMLTAFEPEASDEEVVAMSDTRTGRAFMLLGRVTGTFD